MTAKKALAFVGDNTDHAAVARDEKYEASFTFGETFPNPYDPEKVEFNAYVLQPDAVRTVIPGFWYAGYDRALAGGKERLIPNGLREWKIRYTPRMAGTYRFYVELADKVNGKTYRYPDKGYVSFDAVASAGKGFLRVSKTDTSYLEYDDGSPFFGIGHNLCGWEWGGTDNAEGTYEYDEWLLNLHNNGANMAQFDFCEGDQIEWTGNADELPFSSDWQGLNQYNQQTAWKMDCRFQKAEELGIYFRLTLFHWEDFDNETENFPDWGWNRNPYNSLNGGTVDCVSRFFSDAKSKEYVKKYLRYVVARWGYSGNILAYELWNEVDAPDMIWGEGSDYSAAAADITQWHEEMAAYLQSADPNGHLVTTSFADSRNGSDVWKLPGIDLTTFHRYTFYNPDYGDPKYETVETLDKLITQRYKTSGKPVLAGEFALSPGGDIQKDFDRNGIAFHSQLWASLLSKSLGTAMHWTWGSYIQAYNLYGMYKPLHAFTADEDFRGLTAFDNFSDASCNIQYMGLKGSDRAYLWVRDRGYDFASVQGGYVPALIRGGTIAIGGLEASDYVVEFIDAYSGGSLGREVVSGAGAALNINLPDFQRDIAVKIKKKADMPEWRSEDIPAQKNSSSTSIVGKTVAIHAGGAGIAGFQDDFRYVYESRTGDFQITARIDSLTNLGEKPCAGLMIRESNLNNSRFAYLCLNPDGMLRFCCRSEGMATNTQPVKFGFYSYLRLERRGDVIAAFASRDGGEWRSIGEVRLGGLQPQALAGMAATSANPITYVNASFYDVTIR